MPRVKLSKSVIDALPTPAKDIVYWDSGCPGFGVKVTLLCRMRRRLESVHGHRLL
jgi:hypothetical protein